MAEQSKSPGFGRFGVLDEDEDGRVMCHLCGRWFKGLGSHVAQGHGLDPMEYRDAYGLKHGQGLMSAKYREQFRQNGLRTAAAGKSNPPIEAQGWKVATATVRALTTNRAWRERRYPDRSVIINCRICGKEREIPYRRRNNYTTCGDEACHREAMRKRKATHETA